MFKLLNRFAWIISIVIVILIVVIEDDFFIFAIIVWAFIKFWLLRKNFIEERVTFFADAIERNLLTKIRKDNKNLNINTEQIDVKVDKEIVSEEKIALKEDAFERNEVSLNIFNDDIVEKESNLEKIEYESESVKSNNEEIKEEEYIYEPSSFEIYMKKVWSYIKNFFSENILAKIWWIIIFVVVLLLLKIGFEEVWSFGRIIMWTIIWLTVYWTGIWLDKKWLENEAIVLLWIGILINFLVILSWRYLLGDSSWTSPYLSFWITFFFLILNTIFAVVTSFVYNSRSLLVFGFLCAFINPLFFLDNLSTFIVVWYSLIISLGWLYLWYTKKDVVLSIWVFVLWNLLFLVSPFTTELWWVSMLVWSAIVGVTTLYVIYKIKKGLLSTVFWLNYLFIILLLFWIWGIPASPTTYMSYMFSILFFFWIWIYYLLAVSSTLIYQIFLFPVLIVLGLIFSWSIIAVPFSLLLIILFYMWAFAFIWNSISNFFKYFFFWILWFFIFLGNSYIWISYPKIELSNIEFITTVITSFIFLFSSYYLSRKKGLEFLYSIWTIWWIFTLLPVLKVWYSKFTCKAWDLVCINSNEVQVKYSIVALLIFAFLNWLLPFINKNLTEEKANFKNLLIWSVAWILFIGFELFSYWSEYFPWVTTGLAFMALAIIYFVLSFFMIQKIWIENIQSDKGEGTKKNTIFSYLWISISLFSFAIAFVFQDVKEIVSTVWLFEATVLFFFYSRTKERKIYIAWIVLFFIWIFDLFTLLDVVQHRNVWGYSPLISLSIIFISLVLNLKVLEKFNWNEKRSTTFHNILHILGIWVLGGLLYIIIGSTGRWWSILWISIFVAILSAIYSYFNFKLLKRVFVIIFVLFLLNHFWVINNILGRLKRDDIEYLKIIQYISTWILWLALYIWNRFNLEKPLNKFLYVSFAIYLLVITSIYIENIFSSSFAVTMYWWILSFIFITYGLQKNIIKYRTLWLYLLSLTTVKIFFFDITDWIDDNTFRLIAFWVVWILFFVLSSAYSRKMWGSLKWEFNFSNFSSWDDNKDIVDEKKNKESTKVFVINETIKDIDVSEYKWIKFNFEWSKSLEIRSVNLIKIVKMVTNDFENTVFKKWENKDLYDNIVSNYKSELSKANYDKILDIMKKFIEIWGSVEWLKKKK